MNETLRILHIVQSMNRGGIETMLMNFYRNIDREKIQFDFLMTELTKCDYEDEIIDSGGKIFRVSPISAYSPYKYLNDVNRFFKKNPDYRIVHSHMNAVSTLPLFVAKRNHIPVRICHSHSTLADGTKGVLKRILGNQLRYIANNYFACSYAAAKFLYGNWFFKGQSCYVLNNAIDAQLYAFDTNIRSQLREQYNVGDKILIGHVGRFTRAKNHNFILDVFKSVHESNSNTILMLIGDGELRPKIEKKIILLGLVDSVIMTGAVSRVYDYLQAIDLFIFPSLFEGLGMSIIEAQAAGLKCIASDKIPKEAKITDLVEFLPLSQEADLWAEKILNTGNRYERRNVQSQVRLAGYDVKIASKWLENFYLEKQNELRLSEEIKNI